MQSAVNKSRGERERQEERQRDATNAMLLLTCWLDFNNKGGFVDNLLLLLAAGLLLLLSLQLLHLAGIIIVA